MRIKHVYIYWLILSSLTCMISCRKFLAGKSNQKLVLPTTLSNLQALLDNSSIMNAKSTVIDIASSDNYWVPSNTYNSGSEKSRKVYIWQEKGTDFTSFPNDWSILYDVVYYSNIALDNIDKIDRTNQNGAKWDNVKGSAYLFRAYSFFKACVLFAPAYDSSKAVKQPGVVLRLSSDFNIPSTRSDLKTSFKQIQADINSAIKLLPRQAESPTRPSKAAAYALMARVALYMGKYSKAGDYADSSLQIYNALMDYNKKDSMASLPFQRFNEEVVFQKKISLYSISFASPSKARVDTTLYLKYGAGDLRKNLFFKNVTGNEYSFKGNYDGSRTHLFTGIATDEVYLIRAEAYARENKNDLALRDLNHLLEKRWESGKYQPVTASSPVETLNHILKERRKELIFRGLRWMDLKRLNKEGAAITISRNISGGKISLAPNAKMYALPIPETVIHESGIQQNTYK